VSDGAGKSAALGDAAFSPQANDLLARGLRRRFCVPQPGLFLSHCNSKIIIKKSAFSPFSNRGCSSLFTAL
jgi:hypothetical protein